MNSIRTSSSSLRRQGPLVADRVVLLGSGDGRASRVLAADPLASALDLAQQITTRSPDSTAAAKRLLHATYSEAADEARALHLETEVQRRLLLGLEILQLAWEEVLGALAAEDVAVAVLQAAPATGYSHGGQEWALPPATQKS